MSRILVADDNSNIQKMVALALKDEGIDVVAVGNGEAAMRKIPDLRPDLVLADIFMPVRNGYEVCEFVKSDSRYMSTPVVLLVGAFDPLDEQETQRVRADGVLKKPFVPPDPLINMVKALLAKSNGQKSVPVQTPIPPKATAPPPMPPAPAAQPNSTVETQVAPAASLPHPQAERAPLQPKPAVQAPPPFVPPVPSPRPPQAAKPDDPDEVTTAVRDPNLGDPFWATPAQPLEAGAEKSETQPEDIIDMHSFGREEASTEEEDDEDDRSIFRPDSSLLDSVDVDADFTRTIVTQNEPIAPQQARYSQQPAETAQKKEDLGAVMPMPEAPASSAPPPEAAADIFKFDPTLTFALPTQNVEPEQASAEPDETALIEPESPAMSANDDAVSTLPSTTDATPVAPEISLDLRQDEELDPILELPALPNHDAVINAATEAARLAFSELNTLPGSAAPVQTSDRHAGVTDHKETFSPPATANMATAPTPEMIDAVVNRLLEHMQPQIMEVVNREVLRPAIEAIVRREMKKS